MNLLLLSNSVCYDKGYLGWCEDQLKEIFAGCSEVLFISYARPDGRSCEEYTQSTKKKFNDLGINLKGIEEYHNPKRAIKQAQGFFVGGGNTFLLLKTLYENNLVSLLSSQVKKGTPYSGASAGIVIAGPSLGTTNDMPIVQPESFEALNLVPFHVNAHFLDYDESSKHMGESRDTRIQEFLFHNSPPVLGLRENSYLRLKENSLFIFGKRPGKLFLGNDNIKELQNAEDITNLLS